MDGKKAAQMMVKGGREGGGGVWCVLPCCVVCHLIHCLLCGVSPDLLPVVWRVT